MVLVVILVVVKLKMLDIEELAQKINVLCREDFYLLMLMMVMAVEMVVVVTHSSSEENKRKEIRSQEDQRKSSTSRDQEVNETRATISPRWGVKYISDITLAFRFLNWPETTDH